MGIRTRIAPSPTGNLHIGTARTALFNWLFARKQEGEFILRIEDTDLERSEAIYERSIIEGLRWLGLDWDGDVVRQSERTNIYTQYLEQLLHDEKAFWCHHSIEELEKEKDAQIKNGEPPRHLCAHKNSDLGKKEGELIRLSIPWESDRKISFKDSIRGDIEWQEHLLGDISLAKNMTTPLYNFAVVVDDIDMEISHVIRGEDHISNTPKQILIYEALGAKLPQFAHLPLILGSDKSKLSKRHGATSVIEYQKDYLPEALVNFMGFLGYTYSQEIISKEEMADEFDLKKVHKSGAIFNVDRLHWLNAQYIRQLTPEEFREVIHWQNIPDAAIPLMTERLERLSDAEKFNYLWQKPAYDASLLKWKKDIPENTIRGILQAVHDAITKLGEFASDSLRKTLDELSESHGGKGMVYWPVRVALSGQKASPDPVEIAFVIGKEETLVRLHHAITSLS